MDAVNAAVETSKFETPAREGARSQPESAPLLMPDQSLAPAAAFAKFARFFTLPLDTATGWETGT